MMLFIILILGLFFIACVEVAVSLKLLAPNEIAGITRNGNPYRCVGSGLHPVWFPIDSIQKFTTQSQVKNFPPAGSIDPSDLDEATLTLPFVVNHQAAEQALFYPQKLPTDPKEIEKLIKDGPTMTLDDIKLHEPHRYEAVMKDPLQKERVQSLAKGTISWHIDGFETVRVKKITGKKIYKKIPSMKLFQFIRTVGSIEKAWEKIFDATHSILQDHLGKMTLGEALRMIKYCGIRIQHDLEEAAGEEIKEDDIRKKIAGEIDWGEAWGLPIDSFTLTDLTYGQRIKDAIEDAAVAIKESEKKHVESEAEANRIRVEGQAKADAHLAESKAKAEGITLETKALATDEARFARAMDTFESFSKSPNIQIIGDALPSFWKKILTFGEETKKSKKEDSQAA